MRLAQVSGILNAVAAEADIVGLAITEYLPWSVMSSRRRFTLSPYWGRVAPYDGIAGGVRLGVAGNVARAAG